MLSALSTVGLATKQEVAAQNQQEADALRLEQEKLKPQTIEDLVSRKGYDFFSRVKWFVEYLEKKPEEIDIVLSAVQKYMTSGKPGKDFFDQLAAYRQGTLSLALVKAQWPKVFGK